MQPPGGEAVGKYLRVLRNNFAYVVVDASADYTDLALACFDLSDAICLVTGLDVVGVKHLSKALETLLTIGLPRDRFRIVLNRADSKVGLDAGDVERVMKIQVDTMIPSSRLVPTSLNKGRPVVLEEPNSPSVPEHHAGSRSGSPVSPPTSRRRRERSSRARRRTGGAAVPPPLGGEARCHSQTDSPRHSSGTGSPRSARACRSASSRCSGRGCTTPRCRDTELEGLVHQRLRELLDEEEPGLSAQEKLLIVRQIGDSVLGLGPLEPFVRDPEVTEIMVNGWDTIYVERAGKLYWTGTKFHDDAQLRRTIDKIVGKVGRRIDESSPYATRACPTARASTRSSRRSSIDGPSLTIRKFAADPYQARGPGRRSAR